VSPAFQLQLRLAMYNLIAWCQITRLSSTPFPSSPPPQQQKQEPTARICFKTDTTTTNNNIHNVQWRCMRWDIQRPTRVAPCLARNEWGACNKWRMRAFCLSCFHRPHLVVCHERHNGWSDSILTSFLSSEDENHDDHPGWWRAIHCMSCKLRCLSDCAAVYVLHQSLLKAA